VALKLFLDTNVYSLLLRGGDPKSAGIRDFIQTKMETASQLLMPVVVYGELLAGFRGGHREKENRKDLEEFLQEFQLPVLNVTRETAEWYAILRARLNAKGKMIPMNDLWIAALTAQSGSQLLTLDKHFLNLPEMVAIIPNG